MQLREPARTKRTITLTPLIDVVFLLLVFFMLASTFLKFGTVTLETSGGGGSALDPSKIILIHVNEGREVRVNGKLIASDRLKELVNEHVNQGARDAIVVVRQRASVDDLTFAVRQLRQSSASSVRVVD